MRSFNSRLARTYERRSQQQIVVFLAASILIIVVLVMAGIPALFNLSTTISQLRRSPATQTSGDTLVPTTPVFSQDLVATATANIKIAGAADPKTTLKITQNGRFLETVISKDDGSFTYDVSLEKDDNTFLAQAVSETGQKSAISSPYVIKYLTGQPKLDISSPKDGDKINSDQTAVSGKTDPGDVVTVNNRYTIVSGDGSFTYTLNLNSGDNKITVVATDPAGNKTTKEFTVTRS